MFQFTRPQGARPEQYVTERKWGLFQFTRPQGARPYHRDCVAVIVSFNSRAHRGRDVLDVSMDFFYNGFNSRAHRGRDAVKRTDLSLNSVSIHAPTGGAT